MEYVGNGIRKDIVEYVQQSIIPQYAFFDKAHREDHAVAVITSALRLLDSMPESAREDCKDVLYGKSGLPGEEKTIIRTQEKSSGQTRNLCNGSHRIR